MIIVVVTDQSDCNSLQLLWDPDTKQGDNACSKTSPENCAAGDMTEKHGKIRVGARQSPFSRKIYMDSQLPMIPYTGKRKLFVVIFHPDKPDTIVSCARVQKVSTPPYVAKPFVLLLKESSFHGPRRKSPN